MKTKKRHQVRADNKKEYLRELLTKDPSLGTDELNQLLIQKFPSGNPKRPGGLKPGEISSIRFNEFGLRIGPGGYIYNKDNERQRELEARAKQRHHQQKQQQTSTTTGPVPQAVRGNGNPLKNIAEQIKELLESEPNYEALTFDAKRGEKVHVNIKRMEMVGVF